jgi:hypothetical protein
MARVTAFGVNVIEEKVPAPISITLDSSIKVAGSQNVMIGGQGNTQTVTMDIEKMMMAIDSSGAAFTEREEAKSLLKKLSENKLVQEVLGKWAKGLLGGGGD